MAKVGEQIPGTDLQFEEGDIQNLSPEAGGNEPLVIPKDKSIADMTLDELSKQLLGDTGFVSSEPSESDDLIAKTITDLKAGQTAREKGIEAGTERARLETQERGTELLTGAREAQMGVGAASQFALVDRIEKSVEKSLRDLELRKQEMLSTGQVELANKIADLQIQQLTFREQKKQQAFQNILAVGGFALQQQQFGLQKKQAEQQDKAFAQSQFSDRLNILGSSIRKAGGFDKLDAQSQEDLIKLGDEMGISNSSVRLITNSIASTPSLEFQNVGDNLVSVNKDTGKINVLFTSPKSPTEAAEKLNKRFKVNESLKEVASTSDNGFVSLNIYNQFRDAWVVEGLGTIADYDGLYGSRFLNPVGEDGKESTSDLSKLNKIKNISGIDE